MLRGFLRSGLINVLSGIFVFLVLLVCVAAPLITRTPPGSADELRNLANKLLNDLSPYETEAEVKAIVSELRGLRGLLLGLPNNYSEDDLAGEKKLEKMTEALADLAPSLESNAKIENALAISMALKQIRKRVSHRQHHVFPLLSFGPETPGIEADILSAPNRKHFLGTDGSGRDVFSNIVYGLRNALFFSIAVLVVCALIGISLGAVMGFFGGWIDQVLSRITEVIGTFPIFLLQLTILAYFDRSYWILFFVMIFSGWIPYSRFTRAEFYKLRKQEFVQAAEVLGASKWRVIFRHILPNSLTSSITMAPFDLAGTVMALGALSFLGFGEPPDAPSLGLLLKQGSELFRSAWWLVVYPAGTIFMITLSLALFGSAIRDYLDPRHA